MKDFYRQKGRRKAVTSKEWEIPDFTRRRVEIVIQFGIESRVGDVVLMQVTPFWACRLFFNSR